MSALLIPTVQERRLIAALAAMPERAVLLVYRDPKRRKPSCVARVRHAAAELDIVAPPKAPEEEL